MQARAAITGAIYGTTSLKTCTFGKNVLRIFHPHTACVTILSPALLRYHRLR